MDKLQLSSQMTQNCKSEFQIHKHHYMPELELLLRGNFFFSRMNYPKFWSYMMSKVILGNKVSGKIFQCFHLSPRVFPGMYSPHSWK